MKIYTVRAGDSLRHIAAEFGVSPGELAELNQLSGCRRLCPGASLLIPGTGSFIKADIEVHAAAGSAASGAVLREYMPVLSCISSPCCRIESGGELVTPEDSVLRETAAAEDIPVLLTASNISADGSFSASAAHALLMSGASQGEFTENILRLLHSRNYAGLNLNLQYVCPFDRTALSELLEKLSEALHREGFYLFVSLAPKSGSQEGILYAAQDYSVCGRCADRCIILCSGRGHEFSPPRALAPLNFLRRVLEYACGLIPPGKILMGLSPAGCSWQLPWQQGSPGTAISAAAALNLACSPGSRIKFDSSAASPYYTYSDAQGQRRIVWFEDVRSISAKLGLINEFFLAGLSLMDTGRIYRPLLAVLQNDYCAKTIL